MNSHRVLAVLDDTRALASLHDMLEAEGLMTLVHAGDPNQALILAVDGKADVALVDTSTPGLESGLSAFASDLGLPVVYLCREDGPSSPGPLYVKLPCKPGELSAMIRASAHCHELEKAAAQSAQSTGTLLSLMPQIVIHMDSEGRILGINPAAELFARSSEQKARGRHFSSLFQLRRTSTDAALDNPAQLRGSGPDLKDLLLLRSPGGEDCSVRVNCATIRNGRAEGASSLLVLEDVTRMSRCAADRLLLEGAQELTGDAILVTTPGSEDGQPRVRFYNKAFSRLIAQGDADLEGRSLAGLFQQGLDEIWAAVMDGLRCGREWTGQVNMKLFSGVEFNAQVSANPIMDAAGRHLGCVFCIQDRTHLHRLEESIRQSQKIEAVGRLASGIAHDFNNLLSVINSYCDLQILKLDEGSPAMRYAQQIRAAGRKGVDLVSQLMTFSRKDRPNPTQLDLSHVVEDVKSMLRRVIREDIEMETSYEEHLPSVKADQGQIEQVLLNLCVNARDAMPNGGRLHIDVSTRQYEKTVMRSQGSIRPGNYVVLSVEDSGCGMDEETQKRIFDPFFTTKEIGKGTGLGLATVHSIMKQYGGHIVVRSRPGEGSRFELLFPAEGGRSGEAGLHGEHGHSVESPTGSERIFIVEDDETFLDCISGLLRLHGYQVYTAYDGSSAMDMMARLDYEVDLLVSDIVLPKLSGREVAARLMEKRPQARVIFMTGYDDQLDSFYSLPGDAIVLEKPFPLNTLLVKARELLDSAK